MIPLRTDRLSLRAFTFDDVENMVELDADPEVRRHLDGMVPTSPEAARETIERLIRTYPDGSHRGVWAAELDGAFIGWFHLRPARDTGECELGYRLMRRVWNQGLATEGSRYLVEMAFQDGEPKVIARTLQRNVPSRRVMEKLGMVQVREYLYDDRVPAVEYAIENPGAV